MPDNVLFGFEGTGKQLMESDQSRAAQGQLYIVATPIGNLGDITERAKEILSEVSSIAVEDTRHSRRLLQHLMIQTPMFAFHDFNEKAKVANVISRIKEGESIALISDAGTPLISDPGYQLVKLAQESGVKVVPIPGPSAIVAALSCAGLPSDRFTFEGFLPNKKAARLTTLESLVDEQRTMIFYEAPHRIVASLEDMSQVFDGGRLGVIARELTKNFETIKGDTLENLVAWIKSDDNQQRGEFVVLIHGAKKNVSELDTKALHVFDTLLSELPLKQAASLGSKITGIKKNVLYQRGLDKKSEDKV